jgi:hypothetical protein
METLGGALYCTSAYRDKTLWPNLTRNYIWNNESGTVIIMPLYILEF